MKKYIITLFLISNVASFGAGYYISNSDDDVLEIEYREGEEITHKDIKQTDKSLVFTTVAKGKGKIRTKINKSRIPEVRNWWRKNLSEATILPVWNGSNFRMVYQLGYKRRLGIAYIGCNGLYSPRFTEEGKDIFGIGLSAAIIY